MHSSIGMGVQLEPLYDYNFLKVIFKEPIRTLYFDLGTNFVFSNAYIALFRGFHIHDGSIDSSRMHNTYYI